MEHPRERRRPHPNTLHPHPKRTRFEPVAPHGSPRFPIPIVATPALPVLAVARIGLRRVGLVLLDRRRRVRCAQVLDLRQRATRAARLDAVRAKVQYLVRTQNVAVLVLEAETPRSPTPIELRESLRAVAQEEAAWMQERSVKLALTAIGHDAPKTSVIAELAAEYRELAARLDLRHASLFRHRDHERDVRPLVHAFVLAHAVGLEASRGAARPTS